MGMGASSLSSAGMGSGGGGFTYGMASKGGALFGAPSGGSNNPFGAGAG